MTNLHSKELFDLYMDTLKRCGTNITLLDDDDIEYEIFEQFDIGVHSFFHHDSLIILLNAGFINNLIFSKSLQLRHKIIQMQNTPDWNITSIRNSEKWRHVFQLADEIKDLLAKLH